MATESEKDDGNNSKTTNDQDHLTEIIGGVERNLNHACETIINKMKELEKRVAEMEESLERLAEETETKRSQCLP